MMDIPRFGTFKADLEKLAVLVKQEHSNLHKVDHLLYQLANTCPELKKDCSQTEVKEDKKRSEKGKKPKEKKAKQDLKKELIHSLKSGRFVDYTNIEVKTSTEEECVETLRILEEAL